MRKSILALACVAGMAATPAFAAETITASFLQPDGGVTTGLYSGLVSVTVTGIGQSDGTIFNDAFYLLQADPGADPNYYQLTFGTAPLAPLTPSQNAVNYIVGTKPPQSATNTYTFLLDTRTTTPTTLHFGVGDGYFVDNSGSFQITISAIPEPATWAMMLAGFGMVGAASRYRRRSAKVTFA